MSGIQSDAGTLAYWADVLKATVESGWARFGWMNVLTPDVLAYAWWAAIIISVVIGVRMGLSRLKSREVRLAKLIGGIWLAAVLIAYIRINLNRFQPQFRYSFSMIPVLAAFAAVGLLTLQKHHERLQPAAAPLVTAVLFVANLWIIFAIVVPAYT